MMNGDDTSDPPATNLVNSDVTAGVEAPSEAVDHTSSDPLAVDDSELGVIADNIRRYHAAALTGFEQERAGRESWCQNTWALACELKRGKERCQNNNSVFGKWLKAHGMGKDVLSANDRAALLGMAACPVELVMEALQNTKARNWQWIWRNDYDLRKWQEQEQKQKQEREASLCRPTNTPEVNSSEDEDEGQPADDDQPVDEDKDQESKDQDQEQKLEDQPAGEEQEPEHQPADEEPDVEPDVEPEDEPQNGSLLSRKVGLSLSRISVEAFGVEKFRVDALKVTGHLMACLDHPDDDLIAHVKRCLAEITALVERYESNGWTQ